jgi:hypothetical protein
VPVPSSRSAFDVDLGPGPGGQGTWAVYSRCAGNPSRCTLRGTDLATGRERRVGGTATGRLPAIWGSRIAYFGPERHHRSPLRLTDVAGRIDRAVPQRPVADEELPVALDLRGDRVAYVLRTYDAGDDAHDTQFLFTARTDGTGLQRVDTGGDGEECTTNLASPAFISGVSDVLVWLHAAQGTQSTCRPHPQLRRLTLASGAEAYAPVAAAPVAAALVDGHALVLATPPGTADVLTREACRQKGGRQDGCDLTEVPAPAWHAAPG